jgi:hypothetical protein
MVGRTLRWSCSGSGSFLRPSSSDFPGSEYEAIATYQIGAGLPEEEELSLQERRVERSAGIDLGEVHPAVSPDGERAHLLNGRLLREPGGNIATSS